MKTKWKNTSQILYYRLNESYNRTLCIYVFDEYFKRNWRDTNVNIRCLWGWIQWRCVCFFRLFREKIFFSPFFRMENIHCPGDKLLPLVRCYWNLLWCSFFWGRRSPGSVCANAFTTLSEIHRELGFARWRPSPSPSLPHFDVKFDVSSFLLNILRVLFLKSSITMRRLTFIIHHVHVIFIKCWAIFQTVRLQSMLNIAGWETELALYWSG